MSKVVVKHKKESKILAVLKKPVYAVKNVISRVTGFFKKILFKK